MMPRKKAKETQEQQSERFRRAAQELIDAGELSPTDAADRLDKAMGGVAKLRQEWLQGESDQESPP
jgi:hypothetical protein